jgi:hypothetical protein
VIWVGRVCNSLACGLVGCTLGPITSGKSWREVPVSVPLVRSKVLRQALRRYLRMYQRFPVLNRNPVFLEGLVSRDSSLLLLFVTVIALCQSIFCIHFSACLLEAFDIGDQYNKIIGTLLLLS